MFIAGTQNRSCIIFHYFARHGKFHYSLSFPGLETKTVNSILLCAFPPQERSSGNENILRNLVPLTASFRDPGSKLRSGEIVLALVAKDVDRVSFAGLISQKTQILILIIKNVLMFVANSNDPAEAKAIYKPSKFILQPPVMYK